MPVYSLSLPAPVAEYMRSIAVAEDRPMGYVLRRCVLEWMRSHGADVTMTERAPAKGRGGKPPAAQPSAPITQAPGLAEEDDDADLFAGLDAVLGPANV